MANRSRVTRPHRAPAPTSAFTPTASSGRSLDPVTQDEMGARFGHDFSLVRVHTDQEAVEASGALRARAFTVGDDIVFGEGGYDPDRAKGQRLLVHELTHVVQQTRGVPASKAWSATPTMSPSARPRTWPTGRWTDSP